MALIEITNIEALALKKLALINGALVQMISGQAREEQTALLRVLMAVVARADLAAAEAEKEA